MVIGSDKYWGLARKRSKIFHNHFFCFPQILNASFLLTMTHSPLKCRVTDANIVTFQTDGAICLRDAFDQKWIEILRKGIEQNRFNPSAMTKRKGHTPLFFHDYNNWRSTPEYEEFIFQSGAGEIAATLLQSSVSVNDTMAVFVFFTTAVVSLNTRSDEGLTFETSAFSISVRWSIYIINSVDKPNFRVSFLHRRSTTVSSETNPLYSFLKVVCLQTAA